MYYSHEAEDSAARVNHRSLCYSRDGDRLRLVMGKSTGSGALPDAQSARNNHVLAGNFAKYSPIYRI